MTQMGNISRTDGTTDVLTRSNVTVVMWVASEEHFCFTLQAKSSQKL